MSNINLIVLLKLASSFVCFSEDFDGWELDNPRRRSNFIAFCLLPRRIYWQKNIYGEGGGVVALLAKVKSLRKLFICSNCLTIKGAVNGPSFRWGKKEQLKIKRVNKILKQYVKVM